MIRHEPTHANKQRIAELRKNRLLAACCVIAGMLVATLIVAFALLWLFSPKLHNFE